MTTKRKMSKSRREKILGSLRDGNTIRCVWKGPTNSGYLSFQLKGAPRLREEEVNQLKREGLIRFNQTVGSFPFHGYAYSEAGDVHAKTAAKMHGVDEKDVTPEQRREAKAANYGAIYGVDPAAPGEDRTAVRVVWEDATTYSRGDTERVQKTWKASFEGLTIWLTRGHIYYPSSWVVSSTLDQSKTELRGLSTEGDDNIEAAKTAALRAIYKRAETIRKAIDLLGKAVAS